MLHEDEKVIAFHSRDKVANTHIVVLAKTTVESLANIDEESAEHKAMLGHMMVTASKVAKD